MAVLASVRRRYWFDPRVALGALLVLASVAGVVGLVAAQDRSITVYTAAEPLVAGSRVTPADVVARKVRLGGSADLYLTGRPPAAGYVATRTIAAGEMVPLSALGTEASVDVAAVVVNLSTKPAGSVGPGSVVDLWAAPKTGAANTFGPPSVLVTGATVVRLVKPEGLVATSRQDTIEVQVPRDDVAGVLQAVADESAVSAVAVSEPVGR